MANIFASAEKQTQSNYSKPTLTTPESGEGMILRSGRPYENSQESDKQFLFLPFISYDRHSEKGVGLTSFFVKRDFFLAFFGEINLGPKAHEGEESITSLDVQATSETRGNQ